MNPSETERIKLTAGFLNTLASGTIVLAVLSPIVSGLYGNPPKIDPGLFAFGILIWTLTGLGLHLVARAVLGSLR